MEPTTEPILLGHHNFTIHNWMLIPTAPSLETALLLKLLMDVNFMMKLNLPDVSSTHWKSTSMNTGTLMLQVNQLFQLLNTGFLITAQLLSATTADTTEHISPGKPIEKSSEWFYTQLSIFNLFRKKNTIL